MSKFTIMATWDDVPHLNEKDKQDLWNSIPAYQRDARSKGIPQLGSGAVYQVNETDIKCAPFEIPPYWPMLYGFDVGWHSTAACWIAHDTQSDVAYIYSVYKRGKVEPVVHAESIIARGGWIPGLIDPASSGSSQKDGSKLRDEYNDLGLNLYKADNAVESGIFAVEKRLTTGRLKVFSSCGDWFTEYRMYRRNEKGKIVKHNDHLMDCTRYAIMGLPFASLPPDDDPDDNDYEFNETINHDKTAGWY